MAVDLDAALRLQNQYIDQGLLPEVGWLLAKADLGDAEALAELEDFAVYCEQFEVDAI